MKSTPSHRDNSSRFVMFCLLPILAVFGRPTQADYHPPYTFLNALGGPGGGNFEEMCPDDQNLIGFDLRTGDDVDAIRPICVLAYAPNLGGNYQAIVPSGGWQGGSGGGGQTWGGAGWHGGSGGGQSNQVVCPPDKPVVLGIKVYAEGQDTLVVNTISVFCGLAQAYVQPFPAAPSAVFDAPHYNNHGHFSGVLSASENCPAGQVAVGMLGRSGKYVDAMGLICGQARRPNLPAGVGSQPAPFSPSSTTHSATSPSRELPTATSIPAVTPGVGPTAAYAAETAALCKQALDARYRRSPQAAALAMQCRARGGDPDAGSKAQVHTQNSPSRPNR